MLSNNTQITRMLNVHPHFGETVIWGIFFIKFMTKNAVFCRLAQQELKVSYQTGIFWSMFMLPKYW